MMSLTTASRVVATRAFREANFAISKWRIARSEDSRITTFTQVATVLLEMADWMTDMNTDEVKEIEELVVKFNQDLLVWFD